MPERYRFAVAVLLACLAPLAAADTRVTMSKHADAVPEVGEPESDTTNTLWIGDNVFREDTEGQSTIVNLETKKIYILVHADKVYHTIDMPVDLKKLVPEEAVPMIEAALQQMQMKITITPTDEMQEIGGYPARKYEVTMQSQMGLMMEIETWRTSEVELDVEQYKRMMLEVAALQPAATEWMSKLFEIEGFPVRRVTVASMMGTRMQATEEVTEVVTIEPRPGIYAPPEDYKEEPFDPMRMLTQQ
jgi:hypothetical protein